MDSYSLACLAATVAAVLLRRFLAVRILAVAFLLWVAAQQQLDIQQAQRIASMQSMASEREAAASPDLAAQDLNRILRRTPAGIDSLVCVGLALVSVESRRKVPASDRV